VRVVTDGAVQSVKAEIQLDPSTSKTLELLQVLHWVGVQVAQFDPNLLLQGTHLFASK